MPFIFTISNIPRAGDEINVRLEDGDGVIENYPYEVQVGDTLQDIVDELEDLINAGSYFVAVPQTVYAQAGLLITQVTTNNYGGFSGLVTIEYGEASISPAKTLSFDEESRDKAFESFLSYHPECFGVLGTMLMSFFEGNLWTHNSDRYNSFYGVDYESYFIPVFNDVTLQKKTWVAINEIANSTWDCPLIWTNVNSFGNQRQETNLVEAEFQLLEENPSSAIKRDVNSAGGKINGQFMKGNICVITFRKQSASALEYINAISVNYIKSPLTKV